MLQKIWRQNVFIASDNPYRLSCLYNRQTYSVDFLINVERIHVGHAADIVDNSHDARFEVGAR